MYDYLNELHQPTISSENNNEDEQKNKLDNSSNTFFNSHEQQQKQESNGRATLNCSCSQTLSGENIQQIKIRNKHQPRICSLS
jgi:hypothetical protein